MHIKRIKKNVVLPREKLNDFLDIAIGAFESSQAVILRTKAVMQITGSMKSLHKTINLDEKLCTTEFGRMSWLVLFL